MSSSDWIDSLHDATLRSIAFDWRAAIVRIELSRGTIVVEGVTSLVVPRTNAWGPSVSILEGSLVASEVTTLTVHVQSGDDIVVVGRSARMDT